MYWAANLHISNPKTFEEIPVRIPLSSFPLWSEPCDGARPSTGVPYRRITVYIFNTTWILHAPRIGARNLFDAACLLLKTVSAGPCPRREDRGLLWVNRPVCMRSQTGTNFFDKTQILEFLITYIYDIV